MDRDGLGAVARQYATAHFSQVAALELCVPDRRRRETPGEFHSRLGVAAVLRRYRRVNAAYHWAPGEVWDVQDSHFDG